MAFNDEPVSDFTRSVIETHTDVKWIRERLEKQQEDQKEINEGFRTDIDKLKAKVWLFSGVIATLQAGLAFFLEFKR